MQLTKFQKVRIIKTKGKFNCVADMLSPSFTQKELHLNQLKHKQYPPQFHFETLTNDKQIKLLHYLV